MGKEDSEFLKSRVTIYRLLKQINLYLDMAEFWNQKTEMPEEVRNVNVVGFRDMANGIMLLLYTEFGNGPHIEYRGIKAPKEWIERLQLIGSKKWDIS